MDISREEGPDGLRLQFRGALDINSVNEVWAALQPLLAQPLILDLSRISAADTAGLQLLLLVQRDAAHVQFSQPAPALCDLIACFGLPGFHQQATA